MRWIWPLVPCPPDKVPANTCEPGGFGALRRFHGATNQAVTGLAGCGKKPGQVGRPIPLRLQNADSTWWDRCPRPEHPRAAQRVSPLAWLGIVFGARLSLATPAAFLSSLLVSCAACAALVPARAEIIDRIAVSVGSGVITESDIDREIRVTAFLNLAKRDFTPAGKRATAERMVDQRLVRRELEISRYPVPDLAEIQPALEQFQKEHFQSAAEFQRALAAYGLTEDDVNRQLLWQITFLRFIDVRFRPGVQVSAEEIQDYFDRVVKPAAQAAQPGQPVTLEDFESQIESKLAGQLVDRAVDNWLQEVRRSTDIQYREEAFR